jgi:hypothetical protein
VGYYLAIKRNEIVSFAGKWIYNMNIKEGLFGRKEF